MLNRILSAFALLAILLTTAGNLALADDAQPFVYQGRLEGAEGPLTGAFEMVVALYATPEGDEGKLCWEQHTAQVHNGAFRVEIGSGAPLEEAPGICPDSRVLFRENAQVYLQLTVSGETLTPRTRLTSAPYAVSAIHGVPAGTIVAFAGTAAPAGWLLCDGAGYDATAYPGLAAAIGTAYGTGDANCTTPEQGCTFNVPDLRGRFLRGVDGGLGRDPDVANRTPNANGETDAPGSLQGDATALPSQAFQATETGSHQHAANGNHSHAATGSHTHGTAGSHSHAYKDENLGNVNPKDTEAGNNYNDRDTNRTTSPAGDHTHPGAGNHQHSAAGNHQHSAAGTHGHSINGGDAETRPANIYVNYLIKW